MIGKYCLWECRHNKFEVVAPGTNSGFFIILNGKGCRSLWAYQGAHEIVYYRVVVKKILASIPYTEEKIRPPLSVLVGLEYLQHGSLEWYVSHRLISHE